MIPYRLTHSFYHRTPDFSRLNLLSARKYGIIEIEKFRFLANLKHTFVVYIGEISKNDRPPGAAEGKEGTDVDDRSIVELYLKRDERAIAESREKYGKLCRLIAQSILSSQEDAEEVENDAYLKAWNTIPPQNPRSLSAYLAAICRSGAIDRLRGKKRVKRGGAYAETVEELSECLPDGDVAEIADRIALRDALNRFLGELPKDQRVLFMQRYWWAFSVKDLARTHGMSENSVKSTLYRLREKLRAQLLREGIEL